METSEVCALTAVTPTGRTISNPWAFPGFCELAKAFLLDHPVMMGVDDWKVFPFKNVTRITPWIFTGPGPFQTQTRRRYPHVRFTDNLDILFRYIPLKGLWWVLGGFTLFDQVLNHIQCVEATVIDSVQEGAYTLPPERFKIQHTCPHPLAKGFKCVRYERKSSHKDLPPVHLHSV